jgi:long-subunit acyl-CoA synthetase (AMP-forming)
VPTVWETIRKGALMKVEGGSAVARAIFRAAYRVRHAYVHSGLPG